jgi:hypothetical protein
MNYVSPFFDCVCLIIGMEKTKYDDDQTIKPPFPSAEARFSYQPACQCFVLSTEATFKKISIVLAPST